jgi:hypothetical protein
MIVELTDSVKAEIIPGNQSLSSCPLLEIRDLSLCIGSYNSGEEHEKHVVYDTIGSGNWYQSDFDEFCFDKINRLLKSIWLHIPEENVYLEKDFIDLWFKESSVIGTLCLIEPDSFSPEPTDYRWFDPQGQMLICLYERAISADFQVTRLRIAQDFDLVFSNGQLQGWVLFQPFKYIGKIWQQRQLEEGDIELACIVYKYFQLVSEDTIDQLMVKDPELLQSLLSLKKETQDSNHLGYQRTVLKDCIESVIDSFYRKLAAQS